MIFSMKKIFLLLCSISILDSRRQEQKTSSAVPAIRNELWVVNKLNFLRAMLAWKSCKWLNSPSFLFLVSPATQPDKLSRNTLRCCRRCLLSISSRSHNVAGWWWSFHCDSFDLDNIEKVNYIKSCSASRLQLKTHFAIFTRQEVKLYKIF